MVVSYEHDVFVIFLFPQCKKTSNLVSPTHPPTPPPPYSLTHSHTHKNFTSTHTPHPRHSLTRSFTHSRTPRHPTPSHSTHLKLAATSNDPAPGTTAWSSIVFFTARRPSRMASLIWTHDMIIGQTHHYQYWISQYGDDCCVYCCEYRSVTYCFVIVSISTPRTSYFLFFTLLLSTIAKKMEVNG